MGRKQTTPIDDRMHFRNCSLMKNQEKLMHYQYKYMY